MIISLNINVFNNIYKHFRPYQSLLVAYKMSGDFGLGEIDLWRDQNIQ